MTCIDCLSETGKPIRCNFDAAFVGEVCPRCERVWSPADAGSNKRYTTKTAAMRAMEKDKARQRHQLSSLKATVSRILTDRF